VENIILVSGFFDELIPKEQHLFEIGIFFCNNVRLYCTFDQFNASLHAE